MRRIFRTLARRVDLIESLCLFAVAAFAIAASLRRVWLHALLLALGVAVAPAMAQDAGRHEVRYRAAVAAVDSVDSTAGREAARRLLLSVVEESSANPGLPRRFGESAAWLLGEIEDARPLVRLSGRMGRLEDRIARGETGRSVQVEQERLVADLDRLIEGRRAREELRRSPAWRHGGVARLGSDVVAQRRALAVEALERERALQLAVDRIPGRYLDLVRQYYEVLARDGTRGARR